MAGIIAHTLGLALAFIAALPGVLVENPLGVVAVALVLALVGVLGWLFRRFTDRDSGEPMLYRGRHR